MGDVRARARARLHAVDSAVPDPTLLPTRAVTRPCRVGGVTRSRAGQPRRLEATRVAGDQTRQLPSQFPTIPQHLAADSRWVIDRAARTVVFLDFLFTRGDNPVQRCAVQPVQREMMMLERANSTPLHRTALLVHEVFDSVREARAEL
jgi:hypothetical protein